MLHAAATRAPAQQAHAPLGRPTTPHGGGPRPPAQIAPRSMSGASPRQTPGRGKGGRKGKSSVGAGSDAQSCVGSAVASRATSSARSPAASPSKAGAGGASAKSNAAMTRKRTGNTDDLFLSHAGCDAYYQEKPPLATTFKKCSRNACGNAYASAPEGKWGRHAIEWKKENKVWKEVRRGVMRKKLLGRSRFGCGLIERTRIARGQMYFSFGPGQIFEEPENKMASRTSPGCSKAPGAILEEPADLMASLAVGDSGGDLFDSGHMSRGEPCSPRGYVEGEGPFHD